MELDRRKDGYTKIDYFLTQGLIKVLFFKFFGSFCLEEGERSPLKGGGQGSLALEVKLMIYVRVSHHLRIWYK